MPIRRLVYALFVSALVAAIGCGPSGPELGQVSGTISLDGQPLEGAYVTYLPMFPDGIELNAHRKTDANGFYEIQFSGERNGVMLGKHQVMVSTMDDVKDPETGRNRKVPEKVPSIYVNEKSPLILDVKAGENDGSFDLSTDEDKQ